MADQWRNVTSPPEGGHGSREQATADSAIPLRIPNYARQPAPGELDDAAYLIPEPGDHGSQGGLPRSGNDGVASQASSQPTQPDTLEAMLEREKAATMQAEITELRARRARAEASHLHPAPNPTGQGASEIVAGHIALQKEELARREKRNRKKLVDEGYTATPDAFDTLIEKADRTRQQVGYDCYPWEPSLSPGNYTDYRGDARAYDDAFPTQRSTQPGPQTATSHAGPGKPPRELQIWANEKMRQVQNAIAVHYVAPALRSVGAHMPTPDVPAKRGTHSKRYGLPEPMGAVGTDQFSMEPAVQAVAGDKGHPGIPAAKVEALYRQLQKRYYQLEQNIKVLANELLSMAAPDRDQDNQGDEQQAADQKFRQIVLQVMANVQQYKVQLTQEIFVGMNLIDRPLGEVADPLFPRQAPVASAQRKRPMSQLRRHLQGEDAEDDSEDDRSSRRKTGAHGGAWKSPAAPTKGNPKADKDADTASTSKTDTPKPVGASAKN